MSAVLRFGVVNLLPRTAGNVQLLNSALATTAVQPKCFISGKTMRGGKPLTKPKPWDYENKKYGLFQAMYDKTLKRFDENSKLIVVDGPVAANKTKFVKELAEELEMAHFPAVTMDMLYINPYGYDMRKLDPQLPMKVRSFDVRNFCENPNHVNVAEFQIRMYMQRFSQYVDALAHILSTGQGVVLERSCYSDFVFLETLFKHNYISKGARSVYYELRQNTITELLKPHLVIYLDVPVSKVLENIKNRKIDYEVNSKVFTEKYLSDQEAIYKQEYLKDISTHAELLVYDWSNGGETEVVVEDIERIDFDRFDKHDPKIKDWRLEKDWDYCEARILYCNQKADLMNYFNVPRFDVPELLRSPEDSKIFHEVWNDAPGMKYAKGYNADMGDTGTVVLQSYIVFGYSILILNNLFVLAGLLTKNTLDIRNSI